MEYEMALEHVHKSVSQPSVSGGVLPRLWSGWVSRIALDEGLRTVLVTYYIGDLTEVQLGGDTSRYSLYGKRCRSAVPMASFTVIPC